MTRLDSIRKNGLIPERRHDAFLLALLLAVGLNVALFAAQALLPHLASLLQSLGVVPRIERQEEEIPFVLVDPSFLDEKTAPEDAAATAAVNRDARQEESAPAAADDVYRPEGVDEILLMEQGNPGEIEPGVDSAGVPEIEAIGADADVDAPETPEEAQEPVKPVAEPEAREIPEVPETPEVETEAIEPLPAPEPEPVEAPPVVEPIVEPAAEPLPLPPQPEEAPEPDVLPEPAPAPVPDPVELPPEPVPQAVEPVAEPVPGADPVEAPAEIVDLAMLPARDDGIFDPMREAPQERAQPMPPVAAPTPEQYEARDYFQPETRPEQFYRPPEPAPQVPQPNRPVRPPRRSNPDAPQPTFRQLGGASTAGGAPPRRTLTGREVDIFSDPYMALLRDRYPEYMTKLGRALQESLNRTMLLYPLYYATGQAKLLFRIAADGVIEWYETQYPVDGSDNTLRSISERTLLEAGPFDPPPAAMLADPAFRRMSLTVNIY